MGLLVVEHVTHYLQNIQSPWRCPQTWYCRSNNTMSWGASLARGRRRVESWQAWSRKTSTRIQRILPLLSRFLLLYQCIYTCSWAFFYHVSWLYFLLFLFLFTSSSRFLALALVALLLFVHSILLSSSGVRSLVWSEWKQESCGSAKY